MTRIKKINKQTQNSFSPTKYNVGIIGARGYSGLELTKLCLRHPFMKLVFVQATADFDLEAHLGYPQTKSLPSVCTTTPHFKNEKIDVVFLATPTEVSWKTARVGLDQGAHVIDLSGAFRLKDWNHQTSSELYQEWYGECSHECTLANEAIYGLMPFQLKKSSEKNLSQKDKNENTQLIANPGCYATSILMALIPLLREGFIDTQRIVIDAKSGTTGAGRKVQESLLFSEVDGECLPYKIGRHQHLPEILQALHFFSDVNADIIFNTHLLSCRRGIISTLYLEPRSSFSDTLLRKKIDEAYTQHYENYPFVRWRDTETSPQILRLKSVVGTPRVHIGFSVVKGKIFVFSLLDNLLKGAASQAVENFNFLKDLPLDTGLDHLEALT